MYPYICILYTCACICVWTCICIRTRMCIRSACVCLYEYVYVDAYMYMYMHICICLRIHMYLHSHPQKIHPQTAFRLLLTYFTKTLLPYGSWKYCQYHALQWLSSVGAFWTAALIVGAEPSNLWPPPDRTFGRLLRRYQRNQSAQARKLRDKSRERERGREVENVHTTKVK